MSCAVSLCDTQRRDLVRGQPASWMVEPCRAFVKGDAAKEGARTLFAVARCGRRGDCV
jgi:hypothetical protein